MQSTQPPIPTPMAYRHQHNHQPSTCSCSHYCYSPVPTPPPDPLLQSIFSLLLHHYPTPSPAAIPGSACSPFDHRSCFSEQSQYQNQKILSQKEFPLPHQPSENLSQTKCAAYSSLLQRIEFLESSFHRFSSAPSTDSTLNLRDLAARRIQARFRAFLVRRSRGFRRLKELVNVKSTLDDLKSSIIPHKQLDSVFISREAIRLIGRLETILADDKVTRDCKSSVLRDFGEFVEQVEGICGRRNEASSKMIINHCNLDKDEKRLIDSLRERLERLHEICEVVESEDECVGVEKLKRLLSDVEKRVRFLEDENATKVCYASRLSGNVKKIEDTVEKHENPARSVEGNKDEDEHENEVYEDEVETENKGCEGKDVAENEVCEDEDEAENEGSGDDNEAENEVCEDEVETENEGCEDKDEAENGVCEDGDDEIENEGSGDDYETENEICEDEYETEEEGSEVEVESENEVCEHEYETENEGSEDYDETGSEDYEDEDESEEEGSEVEGEMKNVSHNGIPEGNKDHGYVGVMTSTPLTSAQSNMQRHEVSAGSFSIAEIAAYAQQCLDNNREETRDGKGSGGSQRRYLKNVICHNCYKRGHMKRDCWFNPTRRCSNCSEIGHTKEVCSAPV